MTPFKKAATNDSPVSIWALTVRYLENQAVALKAGLGASVAGEVIPFEAAGAQPVDSRLAWNEAVSALSLYEVERPAAGYRAPADWPNLVTNQPPMIAIPFCVGNFPQLVRDLNPLVRVAKLSALRPHNDGARSQISLEAWTKQNMEADHPSDWLLAAGVCRLAKHFEIAERVLHDRRSEVSGMWQAAWANEEAALDWHRGRATEASSLWDKQPDSVPILFNRGMSALFADNPREARPLFLRAVAGIPEECAWHQLGQLYLALADIRQ